LLAAAEPTAAPDPAAGEGADVSPSATTPVPATPATAVAALEPAPTAIPLPAPVESIIGRSYGGRPILAYRFGAGPAALVFVGGMHGGYEWNSILVAYNVVDYLTAHPDTIPAWLRVYVIPSANPDGQALITGGEGRFAPADIVVADAFPGRFNGRGVDLNRNWDCLWSPQAYWRNQPVNPGAHAFSEPENVALRDFILDRQPGAVVFWHSAGNYAFAAGCGGVWQPSRELAERYASAAGYEVRGYTTAYPITGDAADYLAFRRIPAISIELSSHESLDWPQNLDGVLAVIEHYGRVVAPECSRHAATCR
jgi:hypothetical protein